MARASVIWKCGGSDWIWLRRFIACTAEFPKSETYRTQPLRCGARLFRFHPTSRKDKPARRRKSSCIFSHFALGSLAELETQLELVDRLGYSSTQFALASSQIEVARKEAPSSYEPLYRDRTLPYQSTNH